MKSYLFVFVWILIFGLHYFPNPCTVLIICIVPRSVIIFDIYIYIYKISIPIINMRRIHTSCDKYAFVHIFPLFIIVSDT